jgi:hypothetical protein
MSVSQEIVWHATGSVVETFSQEGRKGRLFWKVIIKTDNGFNCLYIREKEIFPTVEKLEIGQVIQAAGVVSTQSEQSGAARPVFLNATQLITVNHQNQ